MSHIIHLQLNFNGSFLVQQMDIKFKLVFVLQEIYCTVTRLFTEFYIRRFAFRYPINLGFISLIAVQRHIVVGTIVTSLMMNMTVAITTLWTFRDNTGTDEVQI